MKKGIWRSITGYMTKKEEPIDIFSGSLFAKAIFRILDRIL